MSRFITPTIPELVIKSDDEIRECLSDLNNASLRKITRESVNQIKNYQKHVYYQKEEINKLRLRIHNLTLID